MKKIDPLLLLTLVAALGCNRDQVQSTRVEKTTPAALPPGHPPAEAPVSPAPLPTGAPAPPPRAVQALQWTLPKGWLTGQSGGMRYATLKPPLRGQVEASVVMLPGPAGGELANVNRWRTQLGLPPIAEGALASARRTVQSKAGAVAVFEFANAGQRMVVGLLTTSGGNTWFLKLMGEDAPVNQAKPDFMKLLGTLDLG